MRIFEQIFLQTRQKFAGILSYGKYFSRSMQQNLPKRHVYTLVKTGSQYLESLFLPNLYRFRLQLCPVHAAGTAVSTNHLPRHGQKLWL